jgi:hypothetical protein
MAATTKPEITKSQAIRDYFKKNPKAPAKEVVTALAKEGFTVTEGLVYMVKGKLKLTQKRKAKASANGTTAKKVKSPASSEAPNKSQAVRGLLSENPKLSVDEVISTLAAKGIDVKRGLVYFVKGTLKSKKRRQAKEKAATELVKTGPSSNGAADALTTIKQIKGLAAELGGMKKLKALVEALSE